MNRIELEWIMAQPLVSEMYKNNVKNTKRNNLWGNTRGKKQFEGPEIFILSWKVISTKRFNKKSWQQKSDPFYRRRKNKNKNFFILVLKKLDALNFFWADDIRLISSQWYFILATRCSTSELELVFSLLDLT